MQRRRLVSWSLSAFVVAVPAAAAFADDLAVPRQYPTIEEALAAAQPGDRVLVRGGAFDNVQIRKGGVSVVAKGTTIRGYLWIDASNVSASGFRLERGAHVVITGDDVTLSGTKSGGRG